MSSVTDQSTYTQQEKKNNEANLEKDSLRDQALEAYMLLNDEGRQDVLGFAKVLLMCQELPAEQTPSIDEWEDTHVTIKRLFSRLADRLHAAECAYRNLLNDYAKVKNELACVDAGEVLPKYLE